MISGSHALKACCCYINTPRIVNITCNEIFYVINFGWVYHNSIIFEIFNAQSVLILVSYL